MPRTASRKKSTAEEPCGSGQSLASIRKDKQAQPGLLAAAARNKSDKTKAKPRAKFNIAEAVAAQSPSTGSTYKKAVKASNVMWKLVKAEYQKDRGAQKKGELTGSIYMNALPPYGTNEEFKAMIKKETKEHARWITDKMCYAAKMDTHEMAEACYNGLRDLAGDKLGDAFDGSFFEEETFKQPSVSIFPIDNMVAIHGDSFAFRDEIKELNYTFKVNDAGLKAWFKETEDFEAEAEGLEEMFTAFGWVVEVLGGAE